KGRKCSEDVPQPDCRQGSIPIFSLCFLSQVEIQRLGEPQEYSNLSILWSDR
ncbi:hypothetical protein J6590_057461, partial [Homalodisca vitripennis]